MGSCQLLFNLVKNAHKEIKQIVLDRSLYAGKVAHLPQMPESMVAGVQD